MLYNITCIKLLMSENVCDISFSGMSEPEVEDWFVSNKIDYKQCITNDDDDLAEKECQYIAYESAYGFSSWADFSLPNYLGSISFDIPYDEEERCIYGCTYNQTTREFSCNGTELIYVFDGEEFILEDPDILCYSRECKGRVYSEFQFQPNDTITVIAAPLKSSELNLSFKISYNRTQCGIDICRYSFYTSSANQSQFVFQQDGYYAGVVYSNYSSRPFTDINYSIPIGYLTNYQDVSNDTEFPEENITFLWESDFTETLIFKRQSTNSNNFEKNVTYKATTQGTCPSFNSISIPDVIVDPLPWYNRTQYEVENDIFDNFSFAECDINISETYYAWVTVPYISKYNGSSIDIKIENELNSLYFGQINFSFVYNGKYFTDAILSNKSFYWAISIEDQAIQGPQVYLLFNISFGILCTNEKIPDIESADWYNNDVIIKTDYFNTSEYYKADEREYNVKYSLQGVTKLVINSDKLKKLVCQNNGLQCLVATSCTVIEEIWTGTCQITSIAIPTSPSFRILHIDNNRLSGVFDITVNPSISELHMDHNQITELRCQNVPSNLNIDPDVKITVIP